MIETTKNGANGTTQTSTALAHRPAGFEPENLAQAEALANALAKSNLLPEALRGKPADIYVTLITGHELGLSPMQAVRSIHIIKGKPALSADLMVALVKRSHECAFFKLVKSDDTAATYSTERRGEGRTELTFTIEQARAAGLLSSNATTWKAYPAAMLRARAASALARAVYPDLVMGIYDPDELAPVAPGTPPPAQVHESSATVVQSAPTSSGAAPSQPPEDRYPQPPVDDAEFTESVLSAAERAEAEVMDAISAAVDAPALGKLVERIKAQAPVMGEAATARCRAAYGKRRDELAKVGA